MASASYTYSGLPGSIGPLSPSLGGKQRPLVLVASTKMPILFGKALSGS